MRLTRMQQMFLQSLLAGPQRTEDGNRNRTARSLIRGGLILTTVYRGVRRCELTDTGRHVAEALDRKCRTEECKTLSEWKVRETDSSSPFGHPFKTCTAHLGENMDPRYTHFEVTRISGVKT